MQALLVYLITYSGLAYIVGHSSISLKPRLWLAGLGRAGVWLVELLECPACLGWWVGPAFTWVEPSLCMRVLSYNPPNAVASSVVFGLFTAGVGFLVGRATGILEVK